ncbi:MAG: hypothetical protein H6Q20_1947 [Bacteroidetes bacterium]|nr:hypothetical protein [Bacteroidota bacterium]
MRTCLADPDKSGQAVHLAAAIGNGRISFADLRFTLSAATDSEYALRQTSAHSLGR